MARYKPYSYDQQALIPIAFHDHIPGTFENALNHISSTKSLICPYLRISIKNDATGVLAYGKGVIINQ